MVRTHHGDRRLDNGARGRCSGRAALRTVDITSTPRHEEHTVTTTTTTRTTTRTNIPTPSIVPTSAPEVLAAVDDLADHIADRAAEIESARRLPDDLVDALTRTGAFRMLVPPSHGGIGADLVTALDMCELLARSDASVAWTTMIGAGVWLDLVGLPPATFDDLYHNGPDVPIAGVFSPSGVAVRVAEGYRVSGRWAFASGCTHATWFYGNCLEEIDGGAPAFRTVLFRPDEIEIEDTWHVLGLRGSGSHHVSVDNVVIPAERTFATFDAEAALDTPAVRVPVPSFIALAVATVAVGSARGALDEIGAIANARTPLLAGSALADNPLFQHDLASADAELRAARALLRDVATRVWETAVARDELNDRERAEIRSSAVSAASTAADVVRTAYHAGGGSAVYDASPLQRRLRDGHTITQHFIVRPDTLTTAGSILLGHEIDVPVF
jgi:indole-3-acetate monooxygenase